MDLLSRINAAYDSSSEEDQAKPQQQLSLETILPPIDIAPDVDTKALELHRQALELSRFETTNQVITKQNHLNGVVEQIHINPAKFHEQFHNFENFGHALNPSDNSHSALVFSNHVEKVDTEANVEGGAGKSRKAYRKELKRTRLAAGDAASGDFQGPWAIYEGMEQFKAQQAELTEDQKELMSRFEEMRKARLEEHKKKDKEEGAAEEIHKATTIFHGTASLEGKGFTDAPSYLRQKEHACFIPKKWMHTFVGHNKGVQKIEFFPKVGHLMLSASHDGTVKIWDVLTHKRCLRTYMGHTKAVRDICFSNDGRRFLSAGFDKVIQLWDTETGKVIRSFTNRKTPFCVKFHPSDDRQNIFLAGCANKKIIQYDTNTSEIVQQYEEHLGSINTLTFIENGRRFVSTADDKKIYLWEFGIPVVAKHISEPDMQAIPAATMHPNGKYFAGQSMDNKIVIYDCKGNFKMNRKKKFMGHVNSGYACGLDFSPDGQFLASGDAEGRMWFWNWKSCKNLRTMKVHEGVCIDVKWHPIEASKVATCGWDGTIKLWD
ncbi:hypothetical protein FGO68_gene16839 [Halteria grandinella]|uniref:Pre-mRNA-processing factor 17 n=1 Tax=Halteria grandinella TaxID=5974 RepID=A0A8J8T3X4_HALGN|nr:hypothetical protein FGO68_gene16839 [Halteria grandinella]